MPVVTTTTLTSQQREIISHALGLGHKSYVYRNLYCVPSGDWGLRMVVADLIRNGLMRSGPVVNEGKTYYVFVTRAGADAIGAQFPE